MSKNKKRQDLYVANLSKMIQMETVSSVDDTNPEKFRRFHALLKELFPAIFGACESMDFDGSILMKWPGTDTDKLPVMFMNHHDVVATDGNWEHDPFSADIADGKIWGRGTMDNKSGLFGMLQAADELAAEGWQPTRDIYFESACTEETSGDGANAISQWMLENGIKLEMLFDEGGYALYDPIGGADGTFAMVGVGEKGCAELKFIARGNGGHASTPGKNTPLVRLGQFMSYIDNNNIFEVSISPTICEMFRRISPYMGRAGLLLREPKRAKPLLQRVLPRISDTANALIQTTLAFTMAQGSDGRNVIPSEAWVIGNMRFSHHQGQKKSLQAVEAVAKNYGIEMEILDPGFESRISDYNGSGFKLMEEAVKATMPNVDAVVPYIMTGASDARFFDRVCDQCIRFLPFTVTDEQVESIHGINENIDVDTLVPAVDCFKYLIRHA